MIKLTPEQERYQEDLANLVKNAPEGMATICLSTAHEGTDKIGPTTQGIVVGPGMILSYMLKQVFGASTDNFSILSPIIAEIIEHILINDPSESRTFN